MWVSVAGVGVGLSGQVGGGSQWPGWGWVSVARLGVGLSGQGGGGSQWPGWGWVSVARVGVGLSGQVGDGLSRRDGVGLLNQGRDGGGFVVRMGWVSVVGIGWVSLIRFGMGWVCGQNRGGSQW